MAASGPDPAVHEYLEPFKLYSLYSVVHNIDWTEAMEGYGAATRYSKYKFPKNITVMLDIGIFGLAFKSISPQYLGVRMEDPFLINDSVELEKLTDLLIRGL